MIYDDATTVMTTMMAATKMRPRTEQAQTATHENVQSALRNLRALRHLRQDGAQMLSDAAPGHRGSSMFRALEHVRAQYLY